MNFFEHQDRARRRTTLLVGYFLLAVLAIIAAVSAAMYLVLWWASDHTYTLGEWWRSELFLGVVAFTLLLILFGSLRKLWQLRDGGTALADMLGAREILPDTREADERRYRNVVEEMAISSGIPAPRTYVLDKEPVINAFVAGFRPTEAVVVITHGTLHDLTRDELQGVIAHEFSHIFNADMRLNMRLLAILSGILTIGRLGEFLLRSSARRGPYRSSRSDVRGQGVILVLGLTLMVIGYVGLFFGRLIKAAISRQREFLADASSVQFTRNPEGIAGALVKIRNGMGTQLATSHAEDMSHMCFGQAVHYRLQGLLATHPPVDARLEAIGPQWLARARVRARQSREEQPATSAPLPDSAASFAGEQPAGSPEPATRASSLVGTVTPDQVGYAASLISAIPASLKEAIQAPQAARLMVYAMALAANRDDPDSLMHLLSLHHSEQDLVRNMTQRMTELGTRLRLPLIDLAMPALKQLPAPEREEFLRHIHALVRADQRLTLFEYVLTRILDDHLAPGAERNQRVRYRRYSQVENDIQLVFSALVHASGAKDQQAVDLFSRMTAVTLPPGRTLLPLARCSMNRLDQSLANLRDLTPLLKGPLVDAMADLVLADGKVQVAETEMLRAICTLLDCPMPPLTHTT